MIYILLSRYLQKCVKNPKPGLNIMPGLYKLSYLDKYLPNSEHSHPKPSLLHYATQSVVEIFYLRHNTYLISRFHNTFSYIFFSWFQFTFELQFIWPGIDKASSRQALKTEAHPTSRPTVFWSRGSIIEADNVELRLANPAGLFTDSSPLFTSLRKSWQLFVDTREVDNLIRLIVL